MVDQQPQRGPRRARHHQLPLKSALMKIEIIHTEAVSKNTDIITVRRDDGKTATVTWDQPSGCVYGSRPEGSENANIEASFARGKTVEAINSVANWE